MSRSFNNDISSPLTAFGDLRTAELTPVVQVDFPYNINTDIVNTTTTGSGTLTQSNSKAVLQTAAATSSSAKLDSIRIAKYRPGQGCLVRFTAIFTTGVANSEQLIGIGDDTDGFFFGYNGATFGVLRKQNGTDNWIAQASWNEDNADNTGTLPTIDFTKGNVYQIRYQWLGFGAITFSIENPETGEFIEVHRIQYANTATTPSVFNPSLPIMARVENTTNNTNIKLETSSMAAFVEGKVELLGPRNSISNTKSAVGTTQTNILTIRVRSTFASKATRVPVFVQFFTVSADGAKPVEIQVTKNATLGGSPSYTDVSTNTSVIDYDTAGTTISGGQRFFTVELAKDESRDRSLVGAEVELVAGDTLTFSAAASFSTSDISAACSWIEDF